MKNSHIIIESSLTWVILLYFKKIYPFIKFFFQKNDNWMLLNNDIQFYFLFKWF